MRVVALLTIALSAGCSGPGEVAHMSSGIDQRLSPALSIDLRVDHDDPVELAHVAAISDSTLLAIEGRTGDLWRLPMSNGRPQRVGSVNSAGKRRVLAMRTGSGMVSMIDAAGRITEDSVTAQAPRIVAHRPPGLRRSLLGFGRLSDGSFLVMESAVSITRGQWIPADTISVTRVFRPDSEVVLARWARGGPRDPLGVVTDFTAAMVAHDTAYVSGSAPPRAAVLTVDGGARLEFRSLTGIAAVRFARADEVRLEQELRRRGVPAAEISRVPKTYPTIAAAIQNAGVWFVSSPTSADRFRLMTACEGRSLRVSVEGPDISGIHFLDSGIVVIRDFLEDGVIRVEFSRYSDFPAGCES